MKWLRRKGLPTTYVPFTTGQMYPVLLETEDHYHIVDDVGWPRLVRRRSMDANASVVWEVVGANYEVVEEDDIR